MPWTPSVGPPSSKPWRPASVSCATSSGLPPRGARVAHDKNDAAVPKLRPAWAEHGWSIEQRLDVLTKLSLDADAQVATLSADSAAGCCSHRPSSPSRRCCCSTTHEPLSRRQASRGILESYPGAVVIVARPGVLRRRPPDHRDRSRPADVMARRLPDALERELACERGWPTSVHKKLAQGRVWLRRGVAGARAMKGACGG